jgi:hypothetical protein
MLRRPVLFMVPDFAAPPVAVSPYPYFVGNRISVGMDGYAGSMARGGIQVGVPGPTGVLRTLDAELYILAWECVGPQGYHGWVL